MSGPGDELEDPSFDRIGMVADDLEVVSAESTKAFLLAAAQELLPAKPDDFNLPSVVWIGASPLTLSSDGVLNHTA
jgi:hypothetical protein